MAQTGRFCGFIFILLLAFSAPQCVSAAEEGEDTEASAQVAEVNPREKITEVRSTFELNHDIDALYNDLAVLNAETRVYTASKRMEAIQTAPIAVSVVTRYQLEALDAQYLPQILRLYPGVDVVQLTRTDYTVDIRGFFNRRNFRPNDIVVLVDNRTICDSYSGNCEWENLNIFPQDVGKIEIVRGGASAIYGANALHGVINIITRPPEALPAFESGTSFSWRGFRERVAASHRFDSYTIKLTGGFDHAEIWNEFEEGVRIPDADGGRTWRFNLAAAKDLQNGAVLRFGTGANTGELLQHTSGGTLLRNDQSTNHVLVEYDHPSLSVRSFWNYHTRESFGALSGRFGGRRSQNLYDLEMTHRLGQLGRSRLSWGGDLRLATIKSDRIVGEESQYTAGLFADGQYNLREDLLLRFAGRLDQHEETGPRFSPRVGVAYQIRPAHTVKVSYNVGYRSPTLSDNFIHLQLRPTLIAGNRDLEPEGSTWYEIGYLFQPSLRLKAGIDLYSVTTENPIRASRIGPNLFSFINSDQTIRGKGGEIWAEYGLMSNVRLIANYGHTRYHQNNDIITAAPHKVNIGLLLNDFHRFTGGVTAHYIGPTSGTFDDEAVKTSAYYLVNLYLSYPFTEHLSAGFNIMNLTNRRHREAPEIGEEIGTDYYATLVYRI